MPPKWRLAAILSLSFSISFMVLLFMPLDMFLHNPLDFIVSWKFILPGLLVFSAVGFVVLSVINIILWQKSTFPCIVMLMICGGLVLFARFALNMFTVVFLYVLIALVFLAVSWVILKRLLGDGTSELLLLALLGILISSYIQMLFLNGNMVQITGGAARYSLLTITNIANLFIWVGIALVPLGLWLILRKRKIGLKLDKAILFSSILISGMQIAGLISTAASTELPLGIDEDIQKYVSFDQAARFNPENNIIVFILDRLSVNQMKVVLEEYPEVYDQLDGFVFYKNNISGFNGTFPSVTTMLTQHHYREEQTFDEYWEEAWAQHIPIDTLRDNGFTTNLYLDRPTTYGSLSRILDRTDNLRDEVDITPNHRGLLTISVRLSFGRFMPYFLKDFFLSEINPDFGNSLFTFEESEYHFWWDPAVGVHSDLMLNDFIDSNEFSADSESKVFSVMHLNCSHIDLDAENGYHINPNSGTIERGGNATESTRACFEILNKYFSKMKEIGVYENSTIILIADHGWTPLWTSSLLIKHPGATGPLQINTEAELTNLYFGASILEMAGLSHYDLGLSYNDIINGTIPPTRMYWSYESWWVLRETTRQIRLRALYEINGDANDFDNWVIYQQWGQCPISLR